MTEKTEKEKPTQKEVVLLVLGIIIATIYSIVVSYAAILSEEYILKNEVLAGIVILLIVSALFWLIYRLLKAAKINL